MNSSLIISTSNGRQVTVGALLTVPGNAKEYSAVATVFAGALQAVRGDASYSPHNMAMLIVNNVALLLLLLLLSLRVVILFKLPLLSYQHCFTNWC